MNSSSFDFGPFQGIAEKLGAGERLTLEDGVRLYQNNDLTTLCG